MTRYFCPTCDAEIPVDQVSHPADAADPDASTLRHYAPKPHTVWGVTAEWIEERA